MVYLWLMISIKFRIFWAHSQCFTSKLTFFKDWPFGHFQGIDTGQTGCHRHMVYLWKMISIKFLIFWAYTWPSTSKLIFFKDWPFDHLWPIKKVRRNNTIFLKIGIRILDTLRLHPCKFHQNPTSRHFPVKSCEILCRVFLDFWATFVWEEDVLQWSSVSFKKGA